MAQESRLSELHEVCAMGDSDLLEEMLMSGKYDHIDYKDPDWDERAPLHWCCIKGKSDMVSSLLEKGAHPGVRTSCGWTPAHFAAEAGRTYVLRMLHQHNAPIDRKDLFGDSPRKLAQIYGHKEAFEFLKIAEIEYRNWRRNAELKNEVEPYDDEDLEWCYKNDIKPEVFVTESEIENRTGTIATLNLSENAKAFVKPKHFLNVRHYPKTASQTKNESRGMKEKSLKKKLGLKKTQKTHKSRENLKSDFKN